MVIKRSLQYRFAEIATRKRAPLFAVTVIDENGQEQAVGTVQDIKIQHMGRRGWEATGPDGHRGVHSQRWQAALALTHDFKTVMPVPFAASRRQEVEG